MQTLDIRFAAQEICNAQRAVVVVIDVLRATSTIVSALGQGCREIVAVNTITEAEKTAARLKGALLAGERQALKPERFDLGNSPREFSAERVAGKTIILTTTNGTKALRSIRHAQEVLMASFLNAEAVVRYLSGLKHDILFYCAGTDGAFSLEDTFCASVLMARLQKRKSELRFTDAAQWSLWALHNRVPDVSELDEQAVLSVIQRSSHALRLRSLGLQKDVDYCGRLNRYDLIPVLDRSNSIKSKHL